MAHTHLQQRAVGLLEGLVHQGHKDRLDDCGHGGSGGEVHVVLRDLRVGHTRGLKQIQHAPQVAVRQLQNRIAAAFRSIYTVYRQYRKKYI